MTAADLTPDNLAILEAKLRADLDMVLKVRAVLEEHLGGQPGVASTDLPTRRQRPGSYSRAGVLESDALPASPGYQGGQNGGQGRRRSAERPLQNRSRQKRSPKALCLLSRHLRAIRVDADGSGG